MSHALRAPVFALGALALFCLAGTAHAQNHYVCTSSAGGALTCSPTIYHPPVPYGDVALASSNNSTSSASVSGGGTPGWAQASGEITTTWVWQSTAPVPPAVVITYTVLLGAQGQTFPQTTGGPFSASITLDTDASTTDSFWSSEWTGSCDNTNVSTSDFAWPIFQNGQVVGGGFNKTLSKTVVIHTVGANTISISHSPYAYVSVSSGWPNLAISLSATVVPDTSTASVDMFKKPLDRASHREIRLASRSGDGMSRIWKAHFLPVD